MTYVTLDTTFITLHKEPNAIVTYHNPYHQPFGGRYCSSENDSKTEK
jgi:hypothetical protein